MKRNILFIVIFALAVVAVTSVFASDLRKSAVVVAVENAGPAVVNISTEQVVKRSSPFRRFADPSFDRFYKDFFEGQKGRSYKRTSLGSGVIIRKDGYILTNEHVVLRGSKITVTLQDGREFPASVVGADPSSDLAILKIEAKRLPTIKIGESDDLMIGETVIAIGNPFGLSHTVTTGVVSALHRSFRASENRVYSDFIQTDASINPGNSGGPLLNIDGELVGINSAIYGNAQGIGFAIPIDRGMRVVDNLISYGKVRHGWIGLRVDDLTPPMEKAFGVRKGKGVIVTKIFDQSPAIKSGVALNDIITQVGNSRVGSPQEYKAAILNITVGSKVSITLVRGGKSRTITMTATELPLACAEDFAWELLGIKVTPNSKAQAKKYRLSTTKGMVITKVRLRSPAGRAGIEPGDVLLAIGDKPMKDIANFHQSCAALRLAQGAVIVVQRGKRGYYLTLGF